jgi:hypothetical protein
MATHAFDVPIDSSLLGTLRTDIEADGFAQDILDHIIPSRTSCSKSKVPRVDYSMFKWHDGLLFRNNQIYAPAGPSRLQIMQYCHGSPLAGHFGVHKTLELITRNYWWCHLHDFVMDYV